MQLTPVIAVHLSAALGALALGPVALWARRSRAQHPRLHRAFGYAWVTLIAATAVSALFIRNSELALLAGFSLIHLLIPFTLGLLVLAIWFVARGDITGHRKTMQGLYFGACVGAGVGALLPGRYLGNLVWGQWLGLLSPSRIPSRDNHMVALILSNTPSWVWGLLVALLAVGWSKTRSRRVSLTRITLLPLGLGGFSLYGMVSAFGASAAVLGGWLMAMLLAQWVVTQLPQPAGVRYDAANRQFQLPGSWVPMALIMGIFLTRYAVGVALAMSPELKADGLFTVVIASLYGVFSGIFAGRAMRLLRLAARPGVATTPALPRHLKESAATTYTGRLNARINRLVQQARGQMALQRDPW